MSVPGPRDKRQDIAEEVCTFNMFKLANNITTDLYNFLSALSYHCIIIDIVLLLFYHIVLSLYFHCIFILLSL